MLNISNNIRKSINTQILLKIQKTQASLIKNKEYYLYSTRNEFEILELLYLNKNEIS